MYCSIIAIVSAFIAAPPAIIGGNGDDVNLAPHTEYAEIDGWPLSLPELETLDWQPVGAARVALGPVHEQRVFRTHIRNESEVATSWRDSFIVR